MLSMALVFYAQTQYSFATERDLEDSLIGCARYEDATLRLQCVDELISEVRNGSTAEQTQPSRTSIATAKNVAEPGLDHDIVSQESSYEHDEPETRISPESTYNLIGTYQDKRKRWYFEFENGETWRQTEARFVPTIKEFPIQVSISKSVFGSHNLRSKEFGKPVKVKRYK
jgi:hypothetical protein